MLLWFSAFSKSEDGESANGRLQSAAVALTQVTYHHNSAIEGEVMLPSHGFIQGVFVLHQRRNNGSSQPASTLCAMKSLKICQVSLLHQLMDS